MFEMDPGSATAVEGLAHLIQTALTPVFLLSGIAALLNVFSARLARVADRCHVLETAIADATEARRPVLQRQFEFLQRRTHALDIAVLLGTAAGGSTCLAALLLFVGALRDTTVAGLLYLSFGFALLFTCGALVAFMSEVLMASRGLKERQAAAVRLIRRRGAKPLGTPGE